MWKEVVLKEQSCSKLVSLENQIHECFPRPQKAEIKLAS